MHPFLPCSFALLLLLFSLSTLSLTDARELPSSFSIVPSDHSDSPFHNNSNGKTIEIDIIAAKYTYLMELKVTTDTTTVETLAVADTGSDLIWLNGEDCNGDACHCEQNSACVKKPTKTEECGDSLCKAVNGACSKNQEKEPCYYQHGFVDGLKTKGVLTSGLFSFSIIGGGDRKDTTFTTVFGVSDESYGPLTQRSVGVVGLGRGEPSLFEQISLIDTSIDFKFSYCLPHHESNSRGKLRFGSEVTISEKSTPLLRLSNEDCKNRYCVQLKGISANDHNIQVSDTTEENKENNAMMIDTGSTLTNLTDELFNKFLDQVRDVIGHKDSEELYGYKHCFKEEDAKKLEKVSFEFDGTTIELLKPDNFFDRVKKDDTSYLHCLTIAKIENEKVKVNILGNRAQMNFKVAFDIKNERKVSFDEEECGKENLESLVFEE